MTMIGKSLIVALGLLAAGSITPASAGPLGSANPAIAVGDADGLHLVGDRGSWVEPKTRWKSSKKYRKHRRGHDYSRYDDHHHKKHFKRKKGRKFFKRGFQGGFAFGDGCFRGGNFNFRY